MFPFQRKNRSRRLSRQREADAARRPWSLLLHPLIPHVILGAAFVTLAVLILAIGDQPLPIRIGEPASFDILSRVSFSFIDETATRIANVQALKNTPNVYNFRVDRFDNIDTSLRRTLESFAADEPAGSGEDPDLVTVKLSEVQIAAVRNAFSPGRKQNTDWFLQHLQVQIEGLVFLANDRYDEERSNNRICVVRPEGQEFVPVANVHPEKEIDRVLRQLPDGIGYRRIRATSISVPFYEAVVEILAPLLRNLYEYDEPATQRAAISAQDLLEPVRIGRDRKDVLVNAGDTITERHLRLLQEEQRAYRKDRGATSLSRVLGLALFTATALLVCAIPALTALPRARSHLRLWVAPALVLVILFIARLVLQQGLSPYLIPVALLSIVLTIACGRAVALAASALATLLVAVLFGNNFIVGAGYIIGAAVAVNGAYHVPSRVRLMLVGFFIGLAQFVTIFSFGLAASSNPRVLVFDASYALANGLAVGLLATGLLPLLERLFSVSTAISLLELSDLNLPLMKQLALTAPGTYNHSLIVGHSAETAAKAVDADALLARVGGFYHDIGKMNKPAYFVENRGPDDSKHLSLSPNMSALVIIAHSKDGLELAHQHRLPAPIRDIIVQHHGTTLVQYFYERARQTNPDDEVDPHAFRYPGPKPRSKEAAIVMLADAIESASRTLRDPTASRLEALVRRICQSRLSDGQLDECNLTLKELHRIADELTRTLISMFHARIPYPNTVS